MSYLDSLTMIRPEDSFLRFGTWSVLLHVGTIALFGFLHIARPIEEPMPLVTVTLLKPPPVQTPPMLRTEQPAAPQQLLPVQKQLRLPSQPTAKAMDIPPPPTRPAVPPVTRKTLYDRRASNVVKLKNFTKLARRPATSLPLPSTISAIPMRQATSGVSRPAPRMTSHGASDTTPKRVLHSGPTGPLQSQEVAPDQAPEPVYPAQARKKGWEGTVIVRVEVRPDGRPENVTVRQSSGHDEFDEAAIEAVEKWTFRPAKDGNIPFRKVVDLPIRFALKKR